MQKQADEPAVIDGENDARRGPRDPVLRSFEILNWIVSESGTKTEWSLREIATGTGMHPSTLHRILSHLVEGNLVRQNPKTSNYGLGLEFMRLTLKAARLDPLKEAARPWMLQLVSLTKETSLLARYDDLSHKMFLVSVVDSPNPIRQFRQVGEWLPVTAGATGLAILASLPESEQNYILSNPLVAFTPTTITNPLQLRQVLAQVRHQGYALSNGMRTPGAVGVAAPIYGPDGEVLGSIGITQPEQRFTSDDEGSQSGLVMKAAREISETLSHSERPFGRGRP